MFNIKAEYKYLDEIYQIELSNCMDKIFSPLERDYGKTNLRNKSNLFTDEQINKLLSLLHPDYHDLGMTISIYKNKRQIILDWLFPIKPYLSKETTLIAAKGKICGNQNNSVISLFPFNYRTNRKVKELSAVNQIRLLTLFALIHEVRHAYQRIHKAAKFNKLNSTYVGAGSKGYHSQWIERDANQFAQRFMNKNFKEINQIFDIDCKWICVWGTFRIM